MKKNIKRISVFLLMIVLTITLMPNLSQKISTLEINKHEVYDSSFVNVLTDGTYKAPNGTTIVVSSGTAKYNGSTNLTVTAANTGYKMTGSGGPYYQLSSMAIVTSPANSGQNAKVAYVLSDFTPVEDENGAYEVWTNGSKVKTYKDLQSAVYAAENNSTIKLNKSVDATGGAYIGGKKLTVDGNNQTINTSTWLNGLFYVAGDAELVINNLKLDGGATGFEVNYAGVTYTNYTIPLVTGSDASDPKANQPAIMSAGNITLNGVNASNVYSTANGAVLAAQSGNVKITNSNFIHNRAANWGGALHLGSYISTTATEYSIKNIEINNTNFDKNYSKYGGAIATINIGGMTINSSSFTNNTGDGGKGGAININDQSVSNPVHATAGLAPSTVTLNNTVFDNNWVGNDGYAIQTYGTNLTLNNCTLKNNVGVHPTSSVGTISVESYYPDTMIYFKATNCLFEGNRGGSSVYSDHAGIVDTKFINTKFINNIGNMTILLYSSQTTIDNCEFIGEKVSKTVIDGRSYPELGSDPPKMTINNTKFTETDGPTDVLVSKYSDDGTKPPYTVEYKGTTVANTLALHESNIEVSGTLVGDITLDETADASKIVVAENSEVIGEVIEIENTYPIFFRWKDGTDTTQGTILYLEKGKTYTSSEITQLLNQNKDGYKMVYYTNSSFTTPWDFIPANAMQTIYVTWEAHTHVYGAEVIAHNGGFYYQCECGSLSEPIIAITIDERYLYDGKTKEVTLLNPNNYSSDKYEIKYYKEQSDGTYALQKKAPKEVGKYKVTLVYNGEESSTFFKIAEGIPNPPTSSTNIVGIVALIAFLLLSVFGINRLALKLKNN